MSSKKKQHMRIVNGTAHKITIYSIADCDQTNPRRLAIKPAAKPVYVIPAGTPLNAVKSNADVPGFSGIKELPFQVKGAVKFTDVDPLPDGDIVVVSNQYRAARVELGLSTERCAVIDSAVYEDGDNPRLVGCTALAIG